MARMVGPVTPFKDPSPRINRRWMAIPVEIRNAILKEDKSYTYQELSNKYGISLSCVWNIRNNKNNKQQ